MGAYQRRPRDHGLRAPLSRGAARRLALLGETAIPTYAELVEPARLSYPFACLTAFLLYTSQRRLWASAIRARPSAVFGPVERPPCNLQRDLPRSTRTRQLRPSLVLAPHSGRSLTLEFHEAGEIKAPSHRPQKEPEQEIGASQSKNGKPETAEPKHGLSAAEITARYGHIRARVRPPNGARLSSIGGRDGRGDRTASVAEPAAGQQWPPRRP
jgi:hypothetical protein